MAQFRAGNDDAFCAIHDRYRQRLFAYTRQMLPGSKQDAEDAVQDVFVRAYSGLRANDRDLALRPWLYRVAHNRCVDQLRRPTVPLPELLERGRSTMEDPIAQAEQRDSLRRLIADVRRLPEQQRSALLMRELGGMSYEELSRTLGLSVPAVKSSLVRARISLAQTAQSRDTPCCEIREELTLAHDRGVRASASARRHLRECTSCDEFRGALRGTSRQLAALVPAFGPVGVIANMLGIGGGGSGGAAATGALGGGAAAAGGVTFISAGHVATLLAAAAVTTGGALEIQHTIAASTPAARQASPWTSPANAGAQAAGVFSVTQKIAPATPGAVSPASSPLQARSAPLSASSTSAAVHPPSQPPAPIPHFLLPGLPPPPSTPAISHTDAVVAPTDPGSAAGASGSVTTPATSTGTAATTTTTSGPSATPADGSGSSTGTTPPTPPAGDSGAAVSLPAAGPTDPSGATSTSSPPPAASDAPAASPTP